jgi:hypothetical protein
VDHPSVRLDSLISIHPTTTDDDDDDDRRRRG